MRRYFVSTKDSHRLVCDYPGMSWKDAYDWADRLTALGWTIQWFDGSFWEEMESDNEWPPDIDFEKYA